MDAARAQMALAFETVYGTAPATGAEAGDATAGPGFREGGEKVDDAEGFVGRGEGVAL